MTARRLGGLLALLLGVGPQLGCVTLPWTVAEAPSARPAQPVDPPPKTVLRTPRSPEDTAQLCVATAQIMEKNGCIEEAIHQYLRARENNPQLHEIAHRLAVLYQRQGDYVHAAEEFQQALKAHPKDPDLLNDMGYYCYEREEWAEAEKWLRQAVAVAPKLQRAWVNLGMTLGRQGRADASYEAFAKVLAPAQAHSNVGVLMAQLGKGEEARRELETVLALEPGLTQARKVLEAARPPAGKPATGGRRRARSCNSGGHKPQCASAGTRGGHPRAVAWGLCPRSHTSPKRHARGRVAVIPALRLGLVSAFAHKPHSPARGRVAVIPALALGACVRVRTQAPSASAGTRGGHPRAGAWGLCPVALRSGLLSGRHGLVLPEPLLHSPRQVRHPLGGRQRDPLFRRSRRCRRVTVRRLGGSKRGQQQRLARAGRLTRLFGAEEGLRRTPDFRVGRRQKETGEKVGHLRPAGIEPPPFLISLLGRVVFADCFQSGAEVVPVFGVGRGQADRRAKAGKAASGRPCRYCVTPRLLHAEADKRTRSPLPASRSGPIRRAGRGGEGWSPGLPGPG